MTCCYLLQILHPYKLSLDLNPSLLPENEQRQILANFACFSIEPGPTVSVLLSHRAHTGSGERRTLSHLFLRDCAVTAALQGRASIVSQPSPNEQACKSMRQGKMLLLKVD